MSASTSLLGVYPHRLVRDVPALWKVLGWAEQFAATLLLAGLLPVLLGCALVIAALSRRSPLVSVLRVGKNGRPFWVLKLRTMWSGQAQKGALRLIECIADEQGPAQKRVGDPRVSHWFARWCRKHSIDELPQLAHVLAGRMSLVGPRPLTRAELELHYARDAQEVLCVKPGLTGLWQVMGRNRLTYAERRDLDLAWVRTRSLRAYAGILLRTVPQVVRGRDAW